MGESYEVVEPVEAVDGLKIGSVDQILQAPDVEEELYAVPEWACALRLRGLTKRQQMDCRKRSIRNGQLDTGMMEMLMFLAGVVEPSFSEAHYGQLMGKSFAVMDRILKRITILSGMKEEDVANVAMTFSG
jgi:hypothetical protein